MVIVFRIHHFHLETPTQRLYMVFKTKRVEILHILDLYSYSFDSELLKIYHVLPKLICNKSMEVFFDLLDRTGYRAL